MVLMVLGNAKGLYWLLISQKTALVSRIGIMICSTR